MMMRFNLRLDGIRMRLVGNVFNAFNSKLRQGLVYDNQRNIYHIYLVGPFDLITICGSRGSKSTSKDGIHFEAVGSL